MCNKFKPRKGKPEDCWHDADEIILHACFQALCDFVEKEKPQNIVDYKHHIGQRWEWSVVRALHKYWRVERPAMLKEIERLRKKWSKSRVLEDPKNLLSKTLKQDDKSFNKMYEIEQHIEKLDNWNLHRMIDLRGRLWC
jgi:hypothetical protein